MIATPAYVEDGRACQIVTVADLLPGDVILGWQGEPWTFGTVERVEREPRQSFGGAVRYSWNVHFTDDTPTSYWQEGDSPRRIAARS